MKRFQGYFVAEGWGRNCEQAIITVLADTESEARERIAAELTKNPSRIGYLRKWAKCGCPVKEV